MIQNHKILEKSSAVCHQKKNIQKSDNNRTTALEQSIEKYYTDNIKSEMRSFKSNENIHKKEGGSYYVVSANKASSVTL